MATTISTLDTALMKMLETALRADRLPHINPGDGNLGNYDVVERPIVKKFVEALGLDALRLENLGYVNLRPGNHPYMVGDLRVVRHMPRGTYEGFLERLLGDAGYRQALADPVLSNQLDLHGHGPTVDINHPQIRANIRELANLPSVEGRYVIPFDPHLLLLAVDPELRPLLGLAFDHAQNDSTTPFTGYSGPWRNATIETYGFPKVKGDQIAAEGVVGLPYILRAADELGTPAPGAAPAALPAPIDSAPHRLQMFRMRQLLNAIPVARRP